LNWISVGRLKPSCSRFCFTSSEIGYFSNFIIPHFMETYQIFGKEQQVETFEEYHHFVIPA
jgi:hypothetical protein